MTTAVRAMRLDRTGTWMRVALPVAAALWLYAPLAPAMVHEWIEFPNLSHGFAIPLIAAYLAWSRREELEAAALAPSFWGVPLLALGMGSFWVGIAGEEPFLARLSFPVTLLGLTLLLAGRQITRQLWMAIAYLIFMIPLPYATLKIVTYRSRLFDATMASRVLEVMGVPVHQIGILLYLPNVTLEVTDQCSSIPALAALIALGVAYASVSGRPLWVRCVLVAATLPFAIAANIFRIASTGAAAYYIGLWTLKTTYHLFNGTVNFLFTFGLLLAFDSVLGRWAARRRG